MALDSTVLQRLTDRGVTLLPPAEPIGWDRLETCCGIRPGRDFRAVYERFAGFLVHDPQSMLMLWTIDEIIAHRCEPSVSRPAMIVIGDFLIWSDLIVAPIADDTACVSLLHEERVLAPSLQTFVERIAAGAFDWLS